MPQINLFISYPHEKYEQAKEVSDFLQSLGLDPWFDKDALIGGQDWDRERLQAQRRSDLTLLIWSEETARRPGVIQTEIKEALDSQKQMPLGSIMLVVCRLEDIPPPIELSTLQYIDIFRPDWRFKLLRSIILKHDQMKISIPTVAQEFLDSQNNARRIRTKTIGSDVEGVSRVTNYFTYSIPGPFWELINAEITADVIGRYFEFGFEGRNCINDVVSNVSWSLDMEEHYSQEGLLALNFSSFWDYGGAHPNRGIYSLNFDESAGGKVCLPNLFGFDAEVLRYLKEAVESDVRHQILLAEGQRSEYSLDGYMDLESIDAWSVLSQWNASRDGLTFYLSQFSGLPYVMGVFISKLPWTYVRDRVSEEFRVTNIYRLMHSQIE